MIKMASSFLGLYVQRDAINLAQKGLDITGHNISNINTEGYSRQRLDLCSVANTKGTLGYITGVKLAGKGSEATGVTQIRDKLLDAKVRKYGGEICDTGAKTNILADIEDILDDYENEASGMATLFGNWKANIQSMSSTSADRQDLANICKNTAQTVINVLKNFEVRINEVQISTEKDIENTNTRINAILSQMGDLNKQIEDSYVQMEDVYATPHGEYDYIADNDYGPLELKDKFNLLCDELSQYINITVTEQPMGSFKVEMGNQTLVYKDKYAKTDIKFVDVEGNDDSNNAADGIEYRYAELFVSSINNSKEWIKCERDITSSLEGLPSVDDGTEAKNLGENIRNLNILINKGEVEEAYKLEKKIMEAAGAAGVDYKPIFKRNIDEYNRSVDADSQIKYPSYAIEISEETQTVTSGSMKGLFDMFNGEGLYVGVNCEHRAEEEYGKHDLGNSYQGIKYYQETLRSFAKTIVNEYNSIYNEYNKQFADLSDMTDEEIAALTAEEIEQLVPEEDRGKLFKMFDFTDGVASIGNMKIADPWKENPLRFVHPEGTEDGDYYYDELDNGYLNKVLSVFDNAHDFGKEPLNYTFEEFIAFYGNALGGQLEGELNTFDAANVVYDSVSGKREEVMGVQMEEEAVNMMTYQKWYNAISRMINALDECLDKLINQTGRVGL